VASPAADHGVIVRTADARVVISVTRLVGQHELVTRPLPPEVAERAALSGGAVLADGSIALIVDCDALGEGAPSRKPSPAPAAA
jgi:two-component system chemotaxis sensor kinase CheA